MNDQIESSPFGPLDPISPAPFIQFINEPEISDDELKRLRHMWSHYTIGSLPPVIASAEEWEATARWSQKIFEAKVAACSVCQENNYQETI